MTINSTPPALADILLVDDRPDNLRLLHALLGEAGYKVRTAIKGLLALKAVQVAKPDLILLDINLPDMKGYEVCKVLQASPDTADIPVIFISALGEGWDKVKAFEVGGVDYITKPFEIQEILVRIKHQLMLCQQKQQLIKQQKQLSEQNAQLQLLLTMTKAIHEASDFHSALEATLCQVCEKIGWDFGEFWIPNEDATSFEYGKGWYVSDRRFEEFRRQSETFTFTTYRTLPRQICLDKQVYWLTDVSVESEQIFRRAEVAKAVGLKACFGVPILFNNKVLAVLIFFKKEPSEPDRALIELVNALATQLSSLIGRKRSESALRESQQQLAVIAANIPGAVYRSLVHSDGQISFIYMSEGEREISGFAPDELIAEPQRYFQMIHPEDRADFDRAFRNSIEFLEPNSYEYRIITQSGEVKWLRASVRCSHLDNGEVVVDGVTLDISDRRRAEERLRLLERAIAASSNGIVITDPTQPDNPVIYVNPGFEKITGYSASEVIGQNCRFLQGHETEQPSLQELRTALAEHRACHVILRNYRQDGTLFWNEFSISPVRDAAGHLTHYIGVQTDITELKQAEAALQDSEKLFRAIFEQAAVGIAQVSLSDRFLQINQRYCDLLGYTESEMLAQKCRDIVHSDDRDMSVEYQRQTLAGQRQTYSIEKRYIHKQGHVQWVNSTVSLVRDAQGVPEYFIKVVEDISDRKQAEAALQAITQQERQKAQQLEKALSELQRTQTQLVQNEKMVSLGQLVAGVAHEINNPVSFISCNINPATEYAQDLLYLLGLYHRYYPDPVPEIAEQLKCIEIDFITKDFPKVLASMREGANRIYEIVLSLRNFSRLDEKECKQVNIHEGIDNTLLILQHRLKHHSTSSEIQVIKEYSELPLVECYPGQLNQVFMNIISNAIDALELGNGEWEMGNREEGYSPKIWICTHGNESGVVIRITDNGPGLTPDLLSRIFDPFFTTKPPGKGTGLGLSISYRIVVEKHGGQLKCNSAVGRGAEFAIELPLTQDTHG
ncbi:MAG TPA: hypothetical protein DDZ80_13560 [Cyanobacteria bacterium UBA8803]|nr:hypothetical protein [Cyanobacteria bacterium UBA9273]HBL59498.1 hypothetical protein [Cyanobacteria bacterium UBA8803]